MAGRWFRFYAAAMRHPKVGRLSDKDFRLWCELLSIASENDGVIPPLEDLKHLLKKRLDHLKGGVDRLLRGGLIDALGDGYEPHDWKELQYKSDSSTDRVKKHRAKRNVSETPPDTETDTETDKTPPTPQVGGGTNHAFFGKTVRLNDRDLSEWRRIYHGISDLEAELSTIDAWWQSQDNPKPKNWFYRTSQMLNRKHQEILRAANDDAEPEGFTGFC